MSLKKYIVPDLIVSLSDIKILLILESPHTNEYLYKHPLAGNSGKKLVKQFKSKGFLESFNLSEPLGCQIKKLSYSKLGIINVSTLPLDKKFYPNNLTQNELKLSNKLNSIKSRLQKKTLVSYKPKGILEKYLMSNFSQRLQNIINQHNKVDPLILIPLGHFATNFLKSANITNTNVKILIGLPHPSARNWSEKVSKSTVFDNISNSLLK